MRHFLGTICLLILTLPAAAPAAAVNPDLNLGFENGEPGGAPRVWFTGGEGYVVALTDSLAHEGKLCLKMERNDPGTKGFGVATGQFPLEPVRGRAITFSGWIRTEDVAGAWAGLWWRVDGPGNGSLAFDNLEGRGPTGTTPWTRYEITLPVAEEATNINFGCLLPGSGTAWFDGLEIAIDGEPYVQIPHVPLETTDAMVAWVARTAHPFATDDPAHDDGDLEFLGDLVGDARIVALGEGTHGTAEFFRMKHRITRYLAEEMGFTHFAIEASMPECERINAYVHGGMGDPAELIAGMYFWTWRTREVLDLVAWMRDYNSRGGEISFQGFDMQFPGQAMENVKAFLAEADPDFLVEAALPYAELKGLILATDKTKDRRTIFQDFDPTGVNAVLAGMKERREAYLMDRPAGEVDRAIQNARIVVQFCEMKTGNLMSVRDRSMADNVDWLLEQAGPEARIVLWAHNGHVSRAGYQGVKSMGALLDERHGQDQVILGFLFHEGTYTAIKAGEGLGSYGTSPSRPGTAEWVFFRTGRPRLVLDLGIAKGGTPESGWLLEPVEYRSIGAGAMAEAFTLGTLADMFDAVVYFETSTPSVLLDAAPPSQW